MLDRRTFMTALAAAVSTTAVADKDTAHGFSFIDIDGAPLPLSRFEGSPFMVVNTASRCGFTYQYDGLQALYDRYRDRGFVVLAVPSDDFGGQELDSEAAVKDFCAVNFSLDIPMTSITRVRGGSAHPFYLWARDVLGPDAAPRWNFHKYLVGPDGRLVTAFPTNAEPTSAKVTDAVETLLTGSGT